MSFQTRTHHGSSSNAFDAFRDIGELGDNLRSSTDGSGDVQAAAILVQVLGPSERRGAIIWASLSSLSLPYSHPNPPFILSFLLSPSY